MQEPVTFEVFIASRRHQCSWCDTLTDMAARLYGHEGHVIHIDYACPSHRKTMNEHLAAWRTTSLASV